LLNSPEGIGVSANGKVVCTHWNGISFYDGTKWDTFTSYNIPYVEDIVVDNKGVVWFGGQESGLIKMENKVLTLYDTLSGLPGMMISALRLAPDGRLWIGTWGFGISVYDGTTFKNYDTLDGLSDMVISDFEFDDLGNVYIAGYNGSLSKFDGTAFTVFTAPTDVYELRDLASDGKGGIWCMCTDPVFVDLLYHFDGNNWTKMTLPQYNYTYCFKSDKNGDLWITTNIGAIKFDGMIWRTYGMKNGLLSDEISSMGISDNNEVWFGSYSGVSKFTELTLIKGKVNTALAAVTSGYAKLFRITKGIKKIIQFDSVSISGGNYQFSSVPVGSYIVYAMGDKATYNGYIGTYNSNTELWQAATPIKTTFCDTSYNVSDIILIELPTPPTGNGRISGFVKSTDGTRAGSEPIKDVDVTLRKVPGGVIKNTKTDEKGFFEFSQLDNGVYGVLVDLPGLEMDTIRTVEITNDDTTHTNQDYEVDSTGIHTGNFSSVHETAFNRNYSVYPNPASQLLNVEFSNSTGSEVKLDLINQQGQVVIHNSYNQKGIIHDKLEMTSLPNGLYLLRIQSDKWFRIVKIIHE
ncbi:T9SS type A sorting domain-containing protein, partial [Bacteroidota bacterium]